MRFILSVFLVLIFAPAFSQQAVQTPKIEAEQQPSSALENQKNRETNQNYSDEFAPLTPSVHPPHGDEKRDQKTHESEHEGTEFWPALLGYRLKVTDTLIATFTALLFWATILLYRATRNLVHGADKTAERQLRAYVGVESISIKKFRADEPIEVEIEIKNFGVTPAENYDTFIYLGIGDVKQTSFSHKIRSGFEDDRETLMPGNNSIVICSLPFPDATTAPAILDSIRDGKIALYVHGAIRYRDFTGTTRYTDLRKLAFGKRMTGGRSPFINAKTGNGTE